jgi:phosphoglycolate phosphatase-like HAD superfamily hydrolase
LDRILGKPEINDAKDALALLIKKGFEVGIASNNFQTFIQNFISYHSGSLNGENGRKPERIEPSIARVVAAGVRVRDFPGQPQRMGQGDQDKIKPKPDFLIRVMDYWKNQYKWEPTEKKDHVVFIDDRDTGAKAAAAAEETAREALKLNRDVKFLRVAAPGGHLTPETIAEIDKESMPHLVADLGQLTQLLVDEGERKKLVVVQHSNGKITAVHKDLLEEFLGHGWTVAE